MGIDKFGAVYNGTITAAATATPVQPGPTPGPPHTSAVTVAGSTSPIGAMSSPNSDGNVVTNDTKINVGLDSVMESQAAQLNLLLYQIYRPYFNADPELVGGDTLTCGVCRKDFALADIVKFIQHKVLTCNKENYQCSRSSENGAAGGDNSPSAASAPVQGGADLRESLNSSLNAPCTTAGTTTSTASTTLSGSGTSVTRRHSI